MPYAKENDDFMQQSIGFSVHHSHDAQHRQAVMLEYLSATRRSHSPSDIRDNSSPRYFTLAVVITTLAKVQL